MSDFKAKQDGWAWDNDPSKAVECFYLCHSNSKGLISVWNISSNWYEEYKNFSIKKPVVELEPQIEGFEFNKIISKNGTLLVENHNDNGTNCTLDKIVKRENFAGFWYSESPKDLSSISLLHYYDSGTLSLFSSHDTKPVRPKYVAFKKECEK